MGKQFDREWDQYCSRRGGGCQPISARHDSLEPEEMTDDDMVFLSLVASSQIFRGQAGMYYVSEEPNSLIYDWVYEACRCRGRRREQVQSVVRSGSAQMSQALSLMRMCTFCLENRGSCSHLEQMVSSVPSGSSAAAALTCCRRSTFGAVVSRM